MASYQPNIPLPTDFLSKSQGDIKNNFTTANNVMNVDHYPFDNLTANKGYHKVVHLVNNVSNPLAVLSTGEIYCRQINSITLDEALFYQSGGGKIAQLTMNAIPVPNTPGFSYLPGGIILNWGTTTIGASAANAFIQPFINNCWIVLPGLNGATSGQNSTLSITARTLTGFSYSANINGSQTTFSWLAIGN